MAPARPRIQSGWRGHHQQIFETHLVAGRTVPEQDGGQTQRPLLARASAADVALPGQAAVFWKGEIIGIMHLCCRPRHTWLAEATSRQGPLASSQLRFLNQSQPLVLSSKELLFPVFMLRVPPLIHSARCVSPERQPGVVEQGACQKRSVFTFFLYFQ